MPQSHALSESFWQSLFSNEDTAAIFCVFSMIVLIVAIPTIAKAWRQIAKDRVDADLKRSMIERGMSVEEIERVLKAKSSDE